MSNNKDPKDPNYIPSLDEVIDAPLKKTGFDLPEGSYPGTLFGWGEPWRLKNTFKKKPEDPDTNLVFSAMFGVRSKDGSVQSVEYLMTVVPGGITNRKTSLYKMLRNIKGGDSKFFKQDNSGDYSEAMSLRKFIGATAVIQITKNKEGFPKVEAISSPVEGLKYPTLEECKSLEAEESKEVPF